MSKKLNWKDIAIRALKTFAQGFLAALTVTLPSADLADVAVIKSLFIGAIAGGFAAVMNFALEIMK